MAIASKTQFSVKTEAFEGPLDLLLNLIERRKLHIGDVGLSQVADEYLEYIKKFSEFPIEDAAHFLWVTSTLLLIKSRALLPQIKFTEEETSNIEELDRRLEMLQILRGHIPFLKERFGKYSMFPRAAARQSVSFSPGKSLSLQKIYPVIKNVMDRIPKPVSIPEAYVKKVVNLETMVEKMIQKIRESISAKFKDVVGVSAGYKTDKIEMIVGFLALLELVKRGMVVARQRGHFGDIMVESEEVGVPRYM